MTTDMNCGDCVWLDVHLKGCRKVGMTEETPACAQFRSLEQDLGQLMATYANTRAPYMYDWLPSSYSDAFMVCVGAGPWKENRRAKVQDDAMEWLGGLDLIDVDDKCDCYPLPWQNKYIDNMVEFLHRRRDARQKKGKEEMDFEDFCHRIERMAEHSPSRALYRFYRACGVPKGAKVLSMFARDMLKIPCFPIDRHVLRYLNYSHLPADEGALVELCKKANLNPRRVATAFVQTGLGKRNPDWSSR